MGSRRLRNVVLTYLHKELARLPSAFRGIVSFLICTRLLSGAVITTTLQPQTVAAWDRYIAAFEAAPARPLLALKGAQPALIDLNANGEVPDGFIHHWIGAELIPNTTARSVAKVLEDYDRYTQIYSPELKLASAKKTGRRSYDVRLITERVEGLLHFAFDMHSHVNYREAGTDTLIESRSYLIRESDSGHAPYTDLMPEGNDHGILWRLNSYWRLRQVGSSVYAECQVVSLSRRPLFGTFRQVKNRARESLAFTLKKTAAASETTARLFENGRGLFETR